MRKSSTAYKRDRSRYVNVEATVRSRTTKIDYDLAFTHDTFPELHVTVTAEFVKRGGADERKKSLESPGLR